jgi:Ca-activated chloride channel family protein
MGLRDQLGVAKGAIRSIVEGLAAKDRFALIGFADEQVSWITPFTDDRERFLRRLDVQDPGGKTALYDALARTPAMVGQGSGERRAVVLFTDGLDNASTIPKLQALWMARQVQVPIYALSFVPMEPSLLPERLRDSLAVLGQFAEETGGGLEAIYVPEDLDRAIARIQGDLRQQYVIGYYSAAEDDDRSFRRIRLIASNPRWTVRTRTGYYP